MSLFDRPPPSTPLPPNKRTVKRPLLHPPIQAPTYTTGTPTIYISASTPLISAAKRIDSFLSSSKPKHPEVVIKGTGKAISRVLEIGCYYIERGEEVRVRTGSLDLVDDVVDVLDCGGLEEREEGGVNQGGARSGGEVNWGLNWGKRRRGKRKRKEVVVEGKTVENDTGKEGEEEGVLSNVEPGVEGQKKKEGSEVEEREITMMPRKTSMVEITISSKTS